MLMASPALAQRGNRGQRDNPDNNPNPNLPGGRAGRPGVGVAGSDANATAARSKLDDALKELDRMMVARQAKFDTSRPHLDAKKSVENALAKLRAEKDRVTAALAKDPAYTAAKRADVDAQVALANAGESARAAASANALRTAGVVARIENDAFARDEGVKLAQSQLQASQDALEKVKADFKRSLVEDGEIKDQQEKIAKLEAQVKAWEERGSTLRQRRN